MKICMELLKIKLSQNYPVKNYGVPVIGE